MGTMQATSAGNDGRRREAEQRGVGRLAGWLVAVVLGLGLVAGSGCRSTAPGAELRRRGDEIVVCGRLFHTGTPVVLWTDPGGYDAYRVERRFVPWAEADWEHTREVRGGLDSPNRFGMRRDRLTMDEQERVRGGGWDLPLLQRVVDQFVLHYDACGTSRRCFQVLHDLRGLSVHFLLDVDGTIYQTLDLKERAWHATTSNSRSVGIEIAQAGAMAPGQTNRLADWYETGGTEGTDVRLRFPASLGETGIRSPGFVGRPIRPERVSGEIQGRPLVQHDFTPEQYAALARLTAALCRVFPRIECDYPRDAGGNLVTAKLPDAELQAYRGVLGHFHIQTDKVDPGPAFQWDRVIGQARKELAGRVSR